MTERDLIKTLNDIEETARKAMVNLTNGTATSGANALGKIRVRAADAVRHHQEDVKRANGHLDYEHAEEGRFK